MKINRKKQRALATYMVFGILLTMLACSSAETQPSPPPSTSTVVSEDRIINYDRPSSQSSETTQTGGFKSYKLASRLMGREMPYRVVLPVDYKNKPAERFAVIYLLHGLTGHFNDWTDRTNLVQIAAKYRFIVVTPEGNNGWYSDSSATPKDKYESYIINELIPEIDKNFRTQTDRQHRVIAGLSMGGYGALKFGLKYPEMFSLVGSFSGALEVGKWSEKAGGNKLIGKSIDKVFGPLNSSARKANDIFSLTRGLSPGNLNSLPFIYLSCGTQDPMLEGNRKLNQILTEKKVKHDFRTRPGNHDWAFWGDEMRNFFEISNRQVDK